MEKFCQSCAMPLNEDNLGTEKDGSSSQEYCMYCYQNGEFTNPDITYAEMLKIGLDGIERGNQNTLVKWVVKKSYPSMLKKTKRWSTS